jgi:hypothetical protein
MVDQSATNAFDAPLERPAGWRATRVLGWLAFASVLGGTFWLYTRPDFMLDFGAFLAFCGIAL